MKKTRHFIRRKIRNVWRTLLRTRTERPALFVVLVALAFSFGGLLVWGGTTISTTLFSNNLVQGLALHYAFEGQDMVGQSPDILFVVGSNPLNAADQYLHDIMTLNLGSEVTLRLASEVAPNLTPYDVVVISESVLSGDVASKYNNAGIGVVNMENASWAAHDLVGGDTTVSARTDVHVAGGSHPVAAGYSGTTTLFTSAAQMRRASTALPSGAVSILQEVGDSSRHIAFAYEEGATMLNAHVAEARRVALGFHSDTYSVFGEPAEDIFTASIYWAADMMLEETITIQETRQFMESTTLAAPVGEGNANHGPYIAHGKQWIFFSNGAGGFVYKTKDLQGGTWSAPSSSYSSYIGQGRYFNITFDGTYFHLFYRISGDGIYRRFTPNPDGTVTADSTHVIYSDATWDLDFSSFYITTDYQGRPWVQFQVTDGVNYKPVVSASTATDGTWSTRAGFPYDLQGSDVSDTHGNHPSIVKLEDEKVIFLWRDTINSRTSARVWDNGIWGSVEDTGFPAASYGRTSAISPAPGEVLMNAFATVAHRATNGVWSDRSPGGMNTSSDNSFSKAGDTVRLWDISGNDSRYKETSDAGQTWGAITTFATATSAPHFTSTSEIDDYHTVVWATGTNPYVRFAGIDGEIVTGDGLGRVTDRSGNDNHGTVSGGVVTSSGRIGQAAEFNGSDGYVSAGNIGTNIRSVSFWVKPSILGGGLMSFNGSQSISDGSGGGGAWHDNWYDDSWSHRKTISVQASMVDATMTDFPVLIQRTDTDWRSTSNGGNVGQTNGNDILFTSSGGVKLDHEIESYNPSTGELVAWVRVPTLSASTNTDIIMYYGNPGASDQQNINGVWDSNYRGVWHLNETVSSSGSMEDSTINGNDGTPVNSPTLGATGRIGGAIYSDGSTARHVNVPHSASINFSGDITLSVWINATVSHSGTPYRDILYKEGPWPNEGWNLRYGGSVFIETYNGSSHSVSDSSLSLSTWRYYVAVLNGSTLRLYRDGQEVGTPDTTAGMVGTANDFHIGEGWGNFGGYVDEVRISNAPRSADWISTEYNNQSSPSTFYSVGAEESSGNPWSHRKTISIQSSLVAENLTNFPVLIQRTDTDWRSTSNGGYVAQTNGNDILFTSSAGVKLDHEIEHYDPTTGELVAWVKVPSVSSTTDTDLHVYYGNATASNQENPAGVWDNNYAAVWRLKENPAGTAPQMLDSTTNANAGTSYGSMTSGDQVAGQIGGSLDFDGANDVIRVPNSTSTNITGDQFTLSAWVYPRNIGCGSTACDDGIISKAHESASNSERYHLGVDNGGAIDVRRFSGTQNFGPTTADVVSNNQWQYIVGRYDGATLKAYYNGSEVGSTAATGNITSSTEDLILGKRYSVDRFYDGRIDEARISNIARSAGWIETEYNNQSSPSTFYTVGASETYASFNTEGMVLSGLTNPTVYIDGSTTNTTLSPNRWHHVTVTTSADINASAVEIGRVGSNYFNGVIDDVRIYDTTLSSSDVDRIYHLGATTTINTSLNPPELQVGLVGYWPFNGLRANWIEETSNAAWSARTRAQGALSYNNLLWIMGGWDGSSGIGDVWYSADGVSWTLATNSPAWGTKATHETLVYDDKMWVIGGGDKSVYYSTDGVAWTQATASAPWAGTYRNQHQLVVYDGRMWMMGGTNGTNQNDVWWSTDGVNWTQATANAGWSDRQNHRVVVYDGRMWVVGGGSMLDVWYSTDGANWTQATSNGGWGGSARFRHGLVVHDDKMWIYGGNNGSGATSDVWWSTDGVSWKQETNAAPWGPREEHGFVVHDDKIWLLGGMGTSGNFNDVWSREEGGLMTDRSGNNNNGVYALGASAEGSVGAGRIGQGLKFSGAASNVATIPDDDSLDIGSGSFTYGAWIKSDSFVGAYDMPIYKGGASAGDIGWDMELGADGWGAGISDGTMVRIVFFNDNGFSPPYLPAGEWYHLMAVVDRSNDEFRAYRDGVLINTTSITGFGTSNSTRDLSLGGRLVGDPNLFNGVIDDVRVYNRALSADEIDRLYHLGATTKVNTTLPAESSAGGPIAHWTFDGSTISGSTVQDVAGTFNGTISGASATPGRIGQALFLDGDNDSVNMGNPAALVFGTNDFSYCYWLKTNATSGQPVGKGVWNFRAWGTYIVDGKVRFEMKIEDPPGTNFTADTPVINNGAWNHLCGTHDRDGLLSVYTNGDLSNTTDMSAAASYGMLTSSDFLIGDGFPGHLEGAVDDVRVYDRVLSEEEVQRLASLAPSSGGAFGVNTPPAPAATGLITVERWDNVAGGVVADIPTGTTPDYTGTLSTMESPFSGDLYGVRIRGYIYPETTGNYSFWLASDDGGALNLSTDDTEGNKVTIASHASWTGSREWNKFSSQQSAPIYLVAGERYYIEALQKENAGGDNLAVAWRLNNTTDPTNGSADDIIPGSVLSEWE